METITKTFSLPSNSYFGGVSEVTLRPLTTKEEKIIFTARDNSFIEKIVKSCIVEPSDIDMNKLHSADITFLLYMLREMTFGGTYKQRMSCPYCNFKQDIEIDITEMKSYTLDLDELEKQLNITLPVCQDELKLHLISHGDIQEINKTITRMVNNNELQDPEGYEYIYRFAKLITSINGEEKPIREVIEYLNNLNLKDFDEIKKTLSNIRIGIDTTNVRECKKCGEKVEVQGLTVPEFFRSY